MYTALLYCIIVYCTIAHCGLHHVSPCHAGVHMPHQDAGRSCVLGPLASRGAVFIACLCMDVLRRLCAAAAYGRGRGGAATGRTSRRAWPYDCEVIKPKQRVRVRATCRCSAANDGSYSYMGFVDGYRCGAGATCPGSWDAALCSGPLYNSSCCCCCCRCGRCNRQAPPTALPTAAGASV
jgi:hypothetical protein